MFKFCQLIIIVFHIWLTIFGKASTTTLPTSKPGCPSICGNVTVPYPFGIDGECSLNSGYELTCNTSFSPPKLYILDTEIIDINGTVMRVMNSVKRKCYGSKEGSDGDMTFDLSRSPAVFSDTKNTFVAVGCDTAAKIDNTRETNPASSGCITSCSPETASPQDGHYGSCLGFSCCQAAIPKGMNNFKPNIVFFPSDASVTKFSPCSYAFLAEEDRFTFNVGDLRDPNFKNRTEASVPVVLEWYIYENGESCDQARRNETSYTCKANSECIDFEKGESRGYTCSCLPGYEGNPYLGCSDVDECSSSINPCSNTCINTDGSYRCSCHKAQIGDGFQNGTRCTFSISRTISQYAVQFGLAMTFGVLICISCIMFIFLTRRRRGILKQREKFFEKNGGIMLKQQISPYEGNDKSFKIYTSRELRAITDNYNQNRIIGHGDYSIVYRGILKDDTQVAVKTSKVVDQTQIEEFINEVVILAQIYHRNVVKLLGCCLETELPILVYEYISNGTLFEHIHRVGGTRWITWQTCIRLALEVADALSYLHSDVSPPVIHRDIKSSNILLDESYVVKISDIGASRLVPIDQNRVLTAVQTTHRYLDPEYLQTNQLTEKSDVYSFGVLLAELLTKMSPISLTRKPEERNLVAYFLRAMKEDRLMEIIDVKLANEASEGQLLEMAKLVKNCLSVKGEDRPTMKEVAVVLEGLKDRMNHGHDQVEIRQ